ncbi:MAG: rhamnulose-1-phosphate aldolase [Raoultibacter sp.]
MADVSSIFQEGISMVRGAVSNVTVEQQGFIKAFVRLCTDGWLQGWHERNGGNLTYRMTAAEVASCQSFFREEPSAWEPLGVQAENLCGEFFVVTGAGVFLRNVGLDPARALGIVEINAQGNARRLVWGFKEGGHPTSEFASHFVAHAARAHATGGACRVLYHAHPTNLIALTFAVPLEARTLSRILWRSMPECLMAFPAGVGVVPFMVPGSAELAQATGALMASYDAVVWAQHGLLCAGPDFDTTFGLMHTLEKSAAIHAQACALNGGPHFPQTITDANLRTLATTLNLPLNEAFLD